MIPVVLLPGSNFLFKSYTEESLSDYYLSNTLSVVSAYANRWFDYTPNEQDTLVVERREILLKTRYGVNIARCRVMDEEWWSTLKDEPIFSIH